MRYAQLQRIAPDPIARLRRLRGMGAPEESEVRAAFSRLFKTNDGQILLNWMIAQSYGRTVPESAGESALRANEVRKKFLDQILSLAGEDHIAHDVPDTPRRGRRSNEPG